MSILSIAELSNPDKSKLGLSIEAAIATCRENRAYTASPHGTNIDEITKAVNSVLKSNYRIRLTDGYNAYIQPPTMDKNSPLWRKEFQLYFSDYLENGSKSALKKSGANIIENLIEQRTGEYKGLAATTEVDIHLGRDIIYGPNVRPSMTTGVLLHELGHGDTMWRSLGHTVRTNYTLNVIQSIMLGNEPRDVKVKLVKAAAKIHNIPIADNVEEMVAINKDEVTYTVVVGGCNQAQRDELGCNGYTARGFESLADAYATINGYGTEVNRFLLEMPGGAANVKGSSARMAAVAGEIFLHVGLTALTMGAWAGILGLLIATHDPEAVIYDDPYARTQRVVNMQIEKLKASGTGNLNVQLQAIEESMQILKMYTKNPHWIQMVSEAVMPSNRLNKNLREFQQMLEQLQSNPLYVKALRLSNMK